MKTRRIAVIAAFVGMIGCSGSNDFVQPVSFVPIDLTVALRELVFADINTYPSALGVIGVPGFLTVPAFNPLFCSFNVGGQGFVCPTIAVNSLTFNVRYFVYDSLGRSLAFFDTVNVASVRQVVDVTGNIQAAAGLAIGVGFIHRHSDLTMTGLSEAVRRVNGATIADDSISADGFSVPQTFVRMTSNTANVTFPRDGSIFPTSGTITTYAVTTATTGITTPVIVSPLTQITVISNSLLTFNGTSVATLVATTNGRTLTCLIDLNGVISARCA